jgi:hypothetical protein
MDYKTYLRELAEKAYNERQKEKKAAEDGIAFANELDGILRNGPHATDGKKPSVPGFPARVAAKVATGMKKSEAVRAVIKEFPDEHAAWLQSGDTANL